MFFSRHFLTEEIYLFMYLIILHPAQEYFYICIDGGLEETHWLSAGFWKTSQFTDGEEASMSWT